MSGPGSPKFEAWCVALGRLRDLHKSQLHPFYNGLLGWRGAPRILLSVQ